MPNAGADSTIMDLARPVAWSARIAFAVGNVAETILSRSFELFVLFFYTQVHGLSGSLAGAAILLALVVDGVSDPLVGSFSDSLRSRFGRRHTLMFLAIVPAAAFFIALFAPPASLQGFALAAWLAMAAIGLRIAFTFFYIPWSAQIAELSVDTKERVTLAILRNVFAALSQFAVVAVSFDLFFVATPNYPKGQENPAVYLPYALAMGVAMALCMLLSAAGTYRRQLAAEGVAAALPQRFTSRALFQAWRNLIFRYKNFRSLFLGSLFALTAFSAFNALTLYLGTYFWNLSGAQIRNWQFALIGGLFLTMVAGKPIIDRLPGPPLFTGGIAGGAFLFAAPMLLRLLGLLPESAENAFPWLVASNGLAGFCLGTVMIVSAVIAAETADDYERRTQAKSTALLFGFVFLAMKSASGLGKLLTGLIVDFVQLPAAKQTQSISTAQVAALGWWCVASLIVLGGLGVWAFAGYQTPLQQSEP